jgi:hypothetical protein
MSGQDSPNGLHALAPTEAISRTAAHSESGATVTATSAGLSPPIHHLRNTASFTPFTGAVCELLHHPPSKSEFRPVASRGSAAEQRRGFSSGRPSVLAEQARIVQLLVERVDVR